MELEWKDRYMELRQGGPEITREDYERLKDFKPEPTACALAVYGAFNHVHF